MVQARPLLRADRTVFLPVSGADCPPLAGPVAASARVSRDLLRTLHPTPLVCASVLKAGPHGGDHGGFAASFEIGGVNPPLLFFCFVIVLAI